MAMLKAQTRITECALTTSIEALFLNMTGAA